HRLRSAAGVDDLACRLGGDEFCLLVGAERQGDIVRIAQFVVDTAHALFKLQPSPPQITTLSIGACPVSPQQTWDDWYANADAALYRAKRLGGDRVEWQDDALAPVYADERRRPRNPPRIGSAGTDAAADRPVRFDHPGRA